MPCSSTLNQEAVEPSQIQADTRILQVAKAGSVGKLGGLGSEGTHQDKQNVKGKLNTITTTITTQGTDENLSSLLDQDFRSKVVLSLVLVAALPIDPPSSTDQRRVESSVQQYDFYVQLFE